MKRIEGITKGKLEELYVEKKFGSPKCGEILGVSCFTILKLLRKHNLPVRTINRNYNIRREALKEHYVDKKYNLEKCGECFNVSSSTILKLLRRYNLPIRHNKKDISKEDLYVHQKLSALKCGEKLGCSEGCILRKLRDFCIPVRPPTAPNTNITKEKLIELYLDEQLSTSQCAKKLNCHKSTIRDNLKKYGISTRTRSEGCMLRDGSRKDITKEGLIELYWDKKYSVGDCSDYLGCSEAAIRKKMMRFNIPARSQGEGKRISKKFRAHLEKIWGEHRIDIEKEDLEDLYINKGLSAELCGEVLGINIQTVLNKLRNYNIPIRSLSEAHQNAYEKGRRKRTYPNKSEEYLFQLIEEVCPNEYKYVGDGSLWIYGLNPDFAHCNGKKKLIELFGEYWHIGVDTPWKRTEFGRKAIFSQLGYDILIVWSKELKDRGAVIERIKEFNNR